MLSRRLLVALVTILALAIFSCGDGTPRIQLLNLAGERVDPLAASESKAIVFLFSRTDCPISNRYAPEVRRLYEKFTPRGVTFWLVYADPDESPEEIRRHVESYGYPCDALRDVQHALVRKTKVRVTPEAAVFLADGQLAYRGRIDDWYVDFGKARAAPTRRDLEEALRSILDGKAVATPKTKAVGCLISELL